MSARCLRLRIESKPAPPCGHTRIRRNSTPEPVSIVPIIPIAQRGIPFTAADGQTFVRLIPDDGRDASFKTNPPDASQNFESPSQPTETGEHRTREETGYRPAHLRHPVRHGPIEWDRRSPFETALAGIHRSQSAPECSVLPTEPTPGSGDALPADHPQSRYSATQLPSCPPRRTSVTSLCPSPTNNLRREPRDAMQRFKSDKLGSFPHPASPPANRPEMGFGFFRKYAQVVETTMLSKRRLSMP